MQRNISTIWWRLGGFVMSLIGAVAWTHDAKAAWVKDELNGYDGPFYVPGTGVVRDNGYNGEWYKAHVGDLSYCNYTDLGSGMYRDVDGVYADTSYITGSSQPWFCDENWWLTADDDDVASEINSILGDDWNSLSGTETWEYSTADDDKHLLYTKGYRLGDRQLEVFAAPGASNYMESDTNTAYILADYGYAYQDLYRIIGCASGYSVLNGASEDSVVTNLDGIYCTSAGGGTTPVVPAACTGIPNDNNLITIYDRGSDGCFFWEADTSTHNLYDATGYFKYTTDCSCWDDGSRICS